MRFEHMTTDQKLAVLLEMIKTLATGGETHHDRDVGRKLDLILLKLEAVFKQGELIMASQADVSAQLDAVSANVADETTVIGSVETLLTNLAQQITDLQTQVANADVPQAVVDKITALGTAITQNKSRLATDVTKNTPAAKS